MKAIVRNVTAEKVNADRVVVEKTTVEKRVANNTAAEQIAMETDVEKADAEKTTEGKVSEVKKLAADKVGIGVEDGKEVYAAAKISKEPVDHPLSDEQDITLSNTKLMVAWERGEGRGGYPSWTGA